MMRRLLALSALSSGSEQPSLDGSAVRASASSPDRERVPLTVEGRGESSGGLTPASESTVVVETFGPSPFGTYSNGSRDDPARILAFLRELVLGKPHEGAGFREPELLVLAAIFFGAIAWALADERARELLWRALPV